MNKENVVSKGTVISAMFLVGGTSIGGGMLALPVATGLGGLFPSLAIMAFCWFAMTASALLLVEVGLWLEEGAHIITMTSRILGPIGKLVSWFLYLYISYASIVAYIAGGGLQFASFFNYFGYEMSQEWGCVLFILLFGGIIYFGSRFLGRVNTFLFVAMIGAYVGLIGLGVDEINLGFLLRKDWKTSIIALPLLLTAFSFQTMVPSLTPYLKRNPNALRSAIIGGTTIAFLIYTLWQCLILGIIPVGGGNGLAAALAKGEPATQFLSEHVAGRWVGTVAEYFAFFAIVTSFLGMTLGLFDFLSDGLKIKKEGSGKVVLALLVAVPSVFCAMYFERIFLLALDTTGGFGDTILNGMIPVLMVWIGRYHMGYTSEFRVPGGRPFLVVIFSLFAFALVMEILALSGVVPSVFEPYDVLEIHNQQLIEVS